MLAVNNLCSAFRQRQNLNEIAVLLDETAEVMRNEWTNLHILLSDLDIRDYSVVHAAALYFIMLNTSSESDQFNECLEKVDSFVSNFSKNQIRSVYKHYVLLIQELVKKQSQSNTQNEKILDIVIKSVKRFQKDASELTALHCSVSQLALQCMMPEVAIPLIDQDIMDLHRSVDGNSFELYFYLSGMVYLSMKHYEKAQFFMELCLFNPTNHASKTVKEAYKKYTLLCLLNTKFDGVAERPLFSVRLERQLKDTFKSTYGEIVLNFNQRCYSRLCDTVRANRSTFEQDKNYGLVKQIVKYFREREILLLTKVYMSLTMSELTQLLQLDSVEITENILFSMISHGVLGGNIDEKNGMVTFGPSRFGNGVNVFEQLQCKMEMVMRLRSNIQKLNEKMALDPVYLKKVIEKELQAIK